MSGSDILLLFVELTKVFNYPYSSQSTTCKSLGKRYASLRKRMQKLLSTNRGFTLVEVLISAGIALLAFGALFSVHFQSQRIMGSIRQTSRAEDIALANIEFLRTRTWNQITNLYVTTTNSGANPSGYSSNLIESVNWVITGISNSPVCSHLEVISGDPLNIGLLNGKRDIVLSPNPATGPVSANVITGTVLVSWDTFVGTRLTNSMTTVITKQGMTAD
jgi:hypothetical protein